MKSSKSKAHAKKRIEAIKVTVQNEERKPFINARLKRIFRVTLNWIALAVVAIHAFITFATGTIASSVFLFMALCYLIGLGCSSLIDKFSLNKNLYITLYAAMACIIAMELYLRTDFKYQGYNEKNGGWFYNSPYRVHSWWNRDVCIVYVIKCIKNVNQRARLVF